MIKLLDSALIIRSHPKPKELTEGEGEKTPNL